MQEAEGSSYAREPFRVNFYDISKNNGNYLLFDPTTAPPLGEGSCCAHMYALGLAAPTCTLIVC